MMMADASSCAPQPAVGSFYRRQPNPRLIAGAHTFTDNKVDTAFADPDLVWDGSKWHLYYSSPHGTFGAPGTGTIIRHATSSDLATWTFQDAPAFAAGTQPTVAIDKAMNRFVMLYNTGTGIAIATSPDGSTFSPTGQMFTPPDNTIKLADPELVFVGGTFYLWFSATNANIRGIGHATSKDLVSWSEITIPTTSLLRASSDAKTGGGQPTAIYDELHCRWELWLSNDVQGDSIGPLTNATAGVWHATSTNAKSWTINYAQVRDVVWDNTANGEHLGIRTGADIAVKNGGRYMLYTGFDNQNVPAGSTLPESNGTTPGVMTLNLATRDAP